MAACNFLFEVILMHKPCFMFATCISIDYLGLYRLLGFFFL